MKNNIPTQSEVLAVLNEIAQLPELSNCRIGLFGSYARNTYNKRSDIDIVYKTGDTEYLESRYKLEDLVKKKLHRPCSFVNYYDLKSWHEEMLEMAKKFGLDSPEEFTPFHNMNQEVIWIDRKE